MDSLPSYTEIGRITLPIWQFCRLRRFGHWTVPLESLSSPMSFIHTASSRPDLMGDGNWKDGRFLEMVLFGWVMGAEGWRMGNQRPMMGRFIGQIGSFHKLCPETASPTMDASYSQVRWVTTGAVCEWNIRRVLYESLRGGVTLLVGGFLWTTANRGLCACY